MSNAEKLKDLINEIINNKSLWNSNAIIGISNLLSRVENESGESFSDFHHELGRTNINNENEHTDFQNLLRRIRDSI